MRLDFALLATSAEVRDGLAYMMGGNWDTVYVDTFPAELVTSVLIGMAFHQMEAGHDHRFELVVLDGTGQRVAPPVVLSVPVQQIPNLPTGWLVPSLTAINLRHLAIPQPGYYSVEVLVDGVHAKSLAFRFLPKSEMR